MTTWANSSKSSATFTNQSKSIFGGVLLESGSALLLESADTLCLESADYFADWTNTNKS